MGSLNMLPYLSELQLKGNPIACYLSYRSQVFNQIQNYVEQARVLHMKAYTVYICVCVFVAFVVL